MATLITNINTILSSVTNLAVVYNRPLDENEHPTGYPAAVFFPDTFNSEFLSTAENLRGYNFVIYIITEANIKTVSQATTIMAKTVDAVMDAFDSSWNGGTTNENHRIWQRISQGRWEYSISEAGVTIIAPLNLIVNLATNT